MIDTIAKILAISLNVVSITAVIYIAILGTYVMKKVLKREEKQ